MIHTGFNTNWFKRKDPMRHYSEQIIKDVRDKGFSNLRLRCRADLYSYNYSAANFTRFLNNLARVVDHCLKHDVIPITSWVHHDAEAYATEEDFEAYVNWWTAVARELKDRDYRLSFNLFTELGIDECKKDGKPCKHSLPKRPDKYNRWTRAVVNAIRNKTLTGGNNAKRILFLSSPGKTAVGLPKIDPEIYRNDSYLMAEWHIYASGPVKKPTSLKYWTGSGDGTGVGKENVRIAIKNGTNFTENTGLLTYFAEWMPQDDNGGKINESEAIYFTRFFVKEIRKAKIPWSLNSLEKYYIMGKGKWRRRPLTIEGQQLNMSKILDNII